MAIPEPIEAFLQLLGFEYWTVPPAMPSTAAAAQTDARAQPDWTTTRVFLADHTPILAVCGDGRRIEREQLRQLAGVTSLREATDDEVAHLYPCSEPGTVPPLGPLYGHQVFVDEELTHHRDLVFSAGTRADAVRMRYADFAELVHPAVGRFTDLPL